MQGRILINNLNLSLKNWQIICPPPPHSSLSSAPLPPPPPPNSLLPRSLKITLGIAWGSPCIALVVFLKMIEVSSEDPPLCAIFDNSFQVQLESHPHPHPHPLSRAHVHTTSCCFLFLLLPPAAAVVYKERSNDELRWWRRPAPSCYRCYPSRVNQTMRQSSWCEGV